MAPDSGTPVRRVRSAPTVRRRPPIRRRAAAPTSALSRQPHVSNDRIAYLKNGGTLEKAAAMANHASTWPESMRG
jgi:hypothetical protein